MLDTATSPTGDADAAPEPPLGRVAFLTNLVPHYRKPVLLALAERSQHLKVLVSTTVEPNRAWQPDWNGLDVQLQRTFTFTQRWRHPNAGGEQVFVHVPFDTFAELRRFRPDVIISVEMGLRSILAALYRVMHKDSRLLVWADYAESTEQGRGRARALVRRLLKNGVDGFIVNGASGGRYMRSLGVPAQRLFTVPYATDVMHFSAYDAVPEPDHLLYAGQLIERKGLLPFLSVLAEWARRHPERLLRFTLAGEGPLRPHLEAVEVPSNLKIEMPGNVPYERLGDLYSRASIFVLPAFADTWALVINEAMAAGLPVLGSTGAQAVEELVREGDSGWLFRAGDDGSVRSAIERCFSTCPEQLDRMRHSARGTAMALTPTYTADLLVSAALAVRRSA